MLATRIHGISPFKGYRVTGFTDEEEEAVGVVPMAPWLLETDLKEKVGVEFRGSEGDRRVYGGLGGVALAA
jgi:hypothetical protein